MARALDGQRALRVGAADLGRLGLMAGDDPHALVDLAHDALRRRDFQERNTASAAGAKDAGARLDHSRGTDLGAR